MRLRNNDYADDRPGCCLLMFNFTGEALVTPCIYWGYFITDRPYLCTQGNRVQSQNATLRLKLYYILLLASIHVFHVTVMKLLLESMDIVHKSAWKLVLNCRLLLQNMSTRTWQCFARMGSHQIGSVQVRFNASFSGGT